MNKDSIIDFSGFIIVKFLSVLLCCIPLRLALCAGRRIGDIACLVNSKRRSIAYANLKSAFPDKDTPELKRILMSHFENLGMSVVELLKIPSMGRKYLDRHVTIENMERVKGVLLKNKGAIVLTAHFGNWEIASLAASLRGYSMVVFARRQKYKRLNNLLNRHREITGCKVVTKGFSAREIIRTLDANGIIAMLADQDAGANGRFVDFFGRPASTAYGFLSFAMRTGASVLPCFIRRVGYDRHVAEIERPVELVDTGNKDRDLIENLQGITGIIESFIKRFPDQWLWSHKRWKSTPRRTVLVLTDGRTGHLNQAMAVAEMIEDAMGLRLKDRGIEQAPIVKIDTVEVRFKNRFSRALLDMASLFAGRRCQGCLRCLRSFLEKETFDKIKGYADIVVSCGASTVAANIFLRYENNAFNIAIMKPGMGRGRKFDTVILPSHDAAGRINRNMLITEMAPNRIGRRKKRDGAKKGMGLLLGGDAKNFQLRRKDVEAVLEAALRTSDEKDLGLFVSSSRRTPAGIESLLKDKLKDNKRCGLLVIASEKNIEGAPDRIFEMSDIVIVSADSVSMVSEAVSSGRYVVVFRGRQEQEKKAKYGRVITGLEKKGYIRTAAPGAIYGTVKEILDTLPEIKIPKDRDKIIERLRHML